MSTYGAEQEQFATVEDTGMLNVRCPYCKTYVPAPYTGLGRYLWTKGELQSERKAFCPNCDTFSLLPTPRVAPEGAEVVLQALDLFIESIDRLDAIENEAYALIERAKSAPAGQFFGLLQGVIDLRAGKETALLESKKLGDEVFRLRKEQLAR
jgi:hypothetical protein